ncbi:MULTISPECIES: phage tail tape measure protein [Desulfovibrio]|uniref:phage tail tape measure protein n=1 Tax=Desulfovibrio TaxID=872 RepID=UPI0012FE267E|nr:MULTISPECIES: phage tail tape measure protein [Desulfovibrio]
MDGVWKTGAGLAASGYAAKKAIDAPVSRERQYLDDANIAEVDVKKLRELDASAVKYGGGTLEGARATRGALFTAGLDFEAVEQTLLGVQRTATATGADGAILAELVAAGLKAGQFKAEDVEKILGMATNAGAVGAFEVKDMAKALPGIMTNAKDMVGVKGAAYHFSNLQVVRDAAGSSDEAATLYENLQSFRNSGAAYKGLKKKGIILTAIYQRTAASGGDMNMAFVDAIQKGVVEKDKLSRFQVQSATPSPWVLASSKKTS